MIISFSTNNYNMCMRTEYERLVSVVQHERNGEDLTSKRKIRNIRFAAKKNYGNAVIMKLFAHIHSVKELITKVKLENVLSLVVHFLR